MLTPDGRTDRQTVRRRKVRQTVFGQTGPPPPQKKINVRSTCTKSGNTLLSSISSLSILSLVYLDWTITWCLLLHLTCYFRPNELG